MSHWKEYMTDAMIDVYDDFYSKTEQECLFCLEQLKKSKEAQSVRLPHENERGVLVRQGARCEIYNISEYWYRRLMLASGFVSSEFYDKHELWSARP